MIGGLVWLESIVDILIYYMFQIKTSKMSKLPVFSKDKVQIKLRELQAQFIKPLTKENLFYHYLPLVGVKSYMELSFSVMNPTLSAQIYRRYRKNP